MILVPLALCLLLFPSREIGIAARKPSPIPIPEKSMLGETLTWDLPSEEIRFWVGGEAPSPMSGPRKVFAGIGLTENDNIWITGVWMPSDRASLKEKLASMFYTQESSYFAESVALEKPFPVEPPKLRLPASVWKRVNEDEAERKKYWQFVRQLWKNHEGLLNENCWEYPTKPVINSDFGRPRTLPNGHTYFHSGVDLRARTGTPLYAANDGLVVYADETVVPGKTVILYHGSGVHSQYMHMSELRVEKGQRIRQGELLGLSGATGRVEGPHLHWEIHWKGRKLDPLKFMRAVEESCPRMALRPEQPPAIF